MVTQLGKFLRNLRNENDEFMIDMAKKLGISPSLLSSIETGRRKISTDLKETLIKTYNLSENSINLLNESISKTQKSVSIPLDGLDDYDQNTIFAFARKFHDLDEETKERIRESLDKE